jgi:hypothetical protein
MGTLVKIGQRPADPLPDRGLGVVVVVEDEVKQPGRSASSAWVDPP